MKKIFSIFTVLIIVCIFSISCKSKDVTLNSNPNQEKANDYSKSKDSTETQMENKLSLKQQSYFSDNFSIDKVVKDNESLSLVGFSESKIYYMIMSDEKPEFTYYSYDCNKNQYELWYASSGNFTTICNEVYKDYIVLCEIKIEEKMSFEIKMVGKNFEKTLFKDSCNGLPIVNIVENQLVLNYQFNINNVVYQPLICIDLDTFKKRVIEEPKYNISEDGGYNGILLQSSDGLLGGIIYEYIILKDELPNLDNSGNVKIYYYNFIDEIKKELEIKLQKKATYVSGDDKCVITSDYAYSEPLKNTGSISILGDNGFEKYIIPDIESGNDILSSEKLENGLIILQTNLNTFIIDIDNKTYDKISNSREFRIYQNSIGYLDNNNQLKIMKYK